MAILAPFAFWVDAVAVARSRSGKGSFLLFRCGGINRPRGRFLFCFRPFQLYHGRFRDDGTNSLLRAYRELTEVGLRYGRL